MDHLIETTLVKKIKEKKELSGVVDSLVIELLKNYLQKYKLSIDNLKPSEKKIIVKEIRAELRQYTGQFQKNTRLRDSFLEQNKIHELLQTHTSTSERYEFYPYVKKFISNLNIKSILDLGCGLNPIALAEANIIYYASDIKEDELELVNKFFSEKNINGKTFICNLKKIDSCNLPNTDLCLIFKVLDIIDKKGHSNAMNLIEKVPCKYILASFSTKKLSGKKMNRPYRAWFEKFLNRKKFAFEKFEIPNEIFYLIKKN
jgi:hypothetical protein